MDQASLTGARLADAVESLAADAGRLSRMGEAMRAFARPDAAATIVDRVVELAGQRGAAERAADTGARR